MALFESYSGATRIIPIVGDPIAQVKAPRGLSLALAERGHDILVVPFQLAPADIAAYFTALSRAKNLAGMIATVPHKFAAFAFADAASERARFFGSANVLRRLSDGRWACDMLDGLGYIRAIEATGRRISAQRALLVGAGGAGSAIALELLNAGAASIAIHDVDPARRDTLVAKLNAAHPGKAGAGSDDPSDFALVVNATPAGMKPGDKPPVMLDRLGGASLVGDVITAPELTPMLLAARQAGCAIVTGVDMFNRSLDLMADFFTGEPGSQSG